MLSGFSMLVSSIILTYSTSAVSGKKIVHFESYSNCKGGNDANYTIFVKDISLRMKSSDTPEMNATVVVLKDYGPIKVSGSFYPGYEATFEAFKCGTSGGHHCERLLSMPINDLCNRLLEKNAFWSPFAENMEPPLTCPLRKGSYRTHMTIDTRTVENLVDANVFYKLINTVKDSKNEVIGCTQNVVRFLAIKSKKKKTSKSAQ